jgi:hypothetical protein
MEHLFSKKESYSSSPMHANVMSSFSPDSPVAPMVTHKKKHHLVNAHESNPKPATLAVLKICHSQY